MIVLDSSAAVHFLVRTATLGDWVGDVLLGDRDLHAPHVLDLEVTGALRGLARGGGLPRTRAVDALRTLAMLRLARYSHVPFLPRIWELSENLRAPDAAFVALAEALDATLVTTDLRLAAAPGVRARILTP